MLNFLDNMEETIKIQEELIKTQNEYIEFLGKELGNNATYLYVHGIIASDGIVKQGSDFRDKIKNLQDKLNIQ